MIDYPIIEKKEIIQSHFSKGGIKLINSKEKEVMEFGTQMHYYMETLDLKNPDYTNIPKEFIDKIEKFLHSDLMKEMNKANIYQEYEFMFDDDNEEKHGIIDLMMEYSDYIDIIDYKLKNIQDDAYTIQLSGYQDYIHKLTNKPVNIYLYSIMDSIYKKL